MDKTGQDTGGFQGGIFSSQSMDSGKDAVFRDTAGVGGMGPLQGRQDLYGSCPSAHEGQAYGDYYGQAAGITGMPSICDCGDGYYNYARRGRHGNGSRRRDGSGNRDGGTGGYGDTIRNAQEGCYNFGDSGNWDGNCNCIGYGCDYGNNCPDCGENYPDICGSIYMGGDRGRQYPQECRGCRGCLKDRKKEYWRPDRLLPLIVAMMGTGMLFLAFLATLFFLACVAVSQKMPTAGKSGEALFYEEAEAPGMSPQEGPRGTEPDLTWEDTEPEEKAEGDYYGEVRDAVRTDLSYSVEWENYEFEENSDTVMISVDYPVIEGEIPNIDLLNDVIASEVDYFREYYEEYSKYMLEDEIFAVYSEGYVTYMDEEVMSVVFAENIYTDYWVDTGLYCVNIDIENGVILDNGGILDVDDEFAIDFRMRSREQNGDVGALEYLTDQEVAYYLTSGSTGIIFFTPMGMEIGLNYGEGYVTVTYKDYREFLLKY